MRYSPQELERWVNFIEENSLARCSFVESRLASDAALREWVFKKPDYRERIFAALVTGDLEYLRSKPRTWVSWIENNPPHLWLSTMPTVMVDLADSKSITDFHEFQRKYGCSPEQLAQLVRHRPYDKPGPVLINLRANNSALHISGDTGQLLGCILAEAQNHPERFYRIQQVREAAFRLLGLDWAAIEGRAKEKGAIYAASYQALKISGSSPGFDVTRDGAWPSPVQFDGRIAYYFAIRDLATRHGGKLLNDSILDDWLDGAHPAVADPSRYRELRDRLSRLYVHHHLLSAPLTGGLGGDYAMLAREVDYATRHVTDPTGIRRGLGNTAKGARVGMATWLFRQQAGMDPRVGKTPRGIGNRPLQRFPDDHQFLQFLGRVDHNRVALTANRGNTMGEIDDVVERVAKRRKRTSTPLDVEEEIVLFRDMINIGARDGCEVPQAILTGVGVAATAVAAVSGGHATGLAALSLSLGSFCDVLGKVSKGLESYAWGRPIAERCRALSDKFCARNMDRVRIDRFVGTLWL